MLFGCQCANKSEDGGKMPKWKAGRKVGGGENAFYVWEGRREKWVNKKNGAVICQPTAGKLPPFNPCHHPQFVCKCVEGGGGGWSEGKRRLTTTISRVCVCNNPSIVVCLLSNWWHKMPFAATMPGWVGDGWHWHNLVVLSNGWINTSNMHES